MSKAILDAATPRPWESDRNSLTLPGNVRLHLRPDVGISSADAELIVLAVNSYESDQQLIRELVGALEAVLHDADTRFGDEERCDCVMPETDCEFCEARAALAHARQQRPEVFE